MGGFILWLVIIIFVIASGNKKKKAQQAAKTAAPKPTGALTPEAKAKLAALQAQAAQTRTAPLSQLSREERAARMRELKEKRAARVASARGTAAQAVEAAESFAEGASHGGSLAGQGLSATDDEGCVGGSLPHDHSEGESRAEHSAHIAAMRARDAEEAAMAEPRGLAELNPQDLRRAVVISEILGKPRALKGIGSRQ